MELLNQFWLRSRYLLVVGADKYIHTYIFFFPFLLVQTKLYKEDWIGLKTLDEEGKVKFISVAGNHLGISGSDMKKYVVPYLEDDAKSGNTREEEEEKEASSKGMEIKRSSFGWLSQVKEFFEEEALLV